MRIVPAQNSDLSALTTLKRASQLASLDSWEIKDRCQDGEYTVYYIRQHDFRLDIRELLHGRSDLPPLPTDLRSLIDRDLVDIPESEVLLRFGIGGNQLDSLCLLYQVQVRESPSGKVYNPYHIVAALRLEQLAEQNPPLYTQLRNSSATDSLWDHDIAQAKRVLQRERERDAFLKERSDMLQQQFAYRRAREEAMAKNGEAVNDGPMGRRASRSLLHHLDSVGIPKPAEGYEVDPTIVVRVSSFDRPVPKGHLPLSMVAQDLGLTVPQTIELLRGLQIATKRFVGYGQHRFLTDQDKEQLQRYWQDTA